MANAGDQQPCPLCSAISLRNYSADNVQMVEGQKTLGSLADRNTKKYSDDQKQSIKTTLDPRK
jgi:hypothetical protein